MLFMPVGRPHLHRKSNEFIYPRRQPHQTITSIDGSIAMTKDNNEHNELVSKGVTALFSIDYPPRMTVAMAWLFLHFPSVDLLNHLMATDLRHQQN